MHEFHAYSALHAAAIIGIAVVSIVASILRRRAGNAIGRWMDLTLTGTLVLVALVCHGTRFWSEPFDGLRTLPLHLCHLSSVLAPIAIATCWWPARVLLYFWGLILGSQALITPVLVEGPAHLEFWRFWVGHGIISVASIYDLAGRQFRPGLRAGALAVAASIGYVIAVMPINILAGANYGYVGPALPNRPSILDLLGPWPLRLLWIGLIGTAVILLAAWPWQPSARRQAARHGVVD